MHTALGPAAVEIVAAWDLSEAHAKRLAGVIDRTGVYLDPLIAVLAPGGGFWTPNGRHRLEAMRRLGAKAIIALVVPRHEIACEILALNTEKAHNLRERAHEVIRIYKGLIEEAGARPESEFAFYLEEAALVTLGLCYEAKAHFAGGAYAPSSRRRCGRSAPAQNVPCQTWPFDQTVCRKPIIPSL